MVIITIATIVLITRVIVQKCRVHQQAIWQRNRKMVVQLTSVSIIYIITWIPNILAFLIALIDPNSPSLQLGIDLFSYFPYIVCVLCPFMCLIGLPEAQEFITRIFVRRNFVQPVPPTIKQRVPTL